MDLEIFLAPSLFHFDVYIYYMSATVNARKQPYYGKCSCDFGIRSISTLSGLPLDGLDCAAVSLDTS